MAPPSPAKKKKKKARRGISLPVTLAVMAMVAAVLLWRGDGYYFLGTDGRVDHPEFRELRPSGMVGYGYGVAGTVLIFANLLYLARRKFAARQLGSMKTWLDLHVFTGLVGAVFVGFHAGFDARSTLNQVTAVSLIVVLFTGIVGRFLYSLIPRPDKYQFKDALGDLDEVLPGVRPHVENAVAAHPPSRPPGVPSLLHTLGSMPRWLGEARARREAAALVLANAVDLSRLDRRQQSEARKVMRQVVRTAAAEVYGIAADQMLRSWRPMHRLFAMTMLCTVIIHIAVAWYWGYRWIFSE